MRSSGEVCRTPQGFKCKSEDWGDGWAFTLDVLEEDVSLVPSTPMGLTVVCHGSSVGIQLRLLNSEGVRH